MDKLERILRDLCIAIAQGEIQSDRFNLLLLEAGIYLDDIEWETANRILSHSETQLSTDRISSWIQ